MFTLGPPHALEVLIKRISPVVRRAGPRRLGEGSVIYILRHRIGRGTVAEDAGSFKTVSARLSTTEGGCQVGLKNLTTSG
jgi:hypothetical protein